VTAPSGLRGGGGVSLPPIVVPVQRPADSKTRLAERLDPRGRRRLTLALTEHVADRLVELTGEANPLFVTESPRVRSRVRARGLDCVEEPPEGDSPGAIVDGVLRRRTGGEGGALVLPVDLPLLRTTTVRTLLRAGRRDEVVLVPDRDHRGTNALWRRPPTVPACRWCGRSSFEAHRRAAERVDGSVRVMRPAAITFDLDTPDELDELLRRPSRLSPPLRRWARECAGRVP